MDDHTLDVPIDNLIEPRTVLRLVNRDSVEYLELRDSLRQRGFINSICVRPATMPGKYEIIDGLYRYSCSRELGFTQVPCLIKYNVTDDDVLALQISANAIRPETRPVEFAQQLKKLLTRRPQTTIADLTCLIRKSPTWINERLGLLRLHQAAQQAVDRGEIPLQSAYMLAKIPPGLQRDYVDAAKTLPPPQFKALAASVIKQFAEAVKQGKMERFYSAFEPEPFLRPLKEMLGELHNRNAGALLIAADECRTPLEGFYCALRWATHLDRQSVDEQRAAARGREKERMVLDVTTLEESSA